MQEAVQTLKRWRTRMLLVNLAYFTVLLALGVLLFLKNAGGAAAYVLVAACLAGYLLLVRPMSRSYAAAVREAILRHAVCGEMEAFEHQAKEGVSAESVRGCGLISPSAQTFMSREHITARCGTLTAELADVTFPIAENGLNAMFNGSFIRLTWPGADFPPVTVKAGERTEGKLSKAQAEVVEKLGELIPGSLYLRTEGEAMFLLLRGRFLGFRVNPLMQISDQILAANPYPELGQAVQLARLMRM